MSRISLARELDNTMKKTSRLALHGNGGAKSAQRQLSPNWEQECEQQIDSPEPALVDQDLDERPKTKNASHAVTPLLTVESEGSDEGMSSTADDISPRTKSPFASKSFMRPVGSAEQGQDEAVNLPHSPDTMNLPEDTRLARDSASTLSDADELHQDVLHNDLYKLQYWRDHLDKVSFMMEHYDQLGLNPLFLAIRLDREKYVGWLSEVASSEVILSTSGHPNPGWGLVQEAICTGRRKTVESLFHLKQKKEKALFAENREDVADVLNEMPDMALEVKLKMKAFPLLRKMLKLSKQEYGCKIYKKEMMIRVDYTEEGKEDHYPHTTIIYRPNDIESGQIVILRNYERVFFLWPRKLVRSRSLKRVDELRQHPLFCQTFDATRFKFAPDRKYQKRGGKKMKELGEQQVDAYEFSGLKFVRRERSEHLPSLHFTKAQLRAAASSGAAGGKRHRLPDLPPAVDEDVFQLEKDYESGKEVGRAMRIREFENQFRGRVMCSRSFPVSDLHLRQVFRVLALLNLVSEQNAAQWARFLDVKPPGFPVLTEVNIVRSLVKARLLIRPISASQMYSDNFFEVPPNFTLSTSLNGQ